MGPGLITGRLTDVSQRLNTHSMVLAVQLMTRFTYASAEVQHPLNDALANKHGGGMVISSPSTLWWKGYQVSHASPRLAGVC